MAAAAAVPDASAVHPNNRRNMKRQTVRLREILKEAENEVD